MTTSQPAPAPGLEPERGFILAVLARGVDADDELAELAELARTAGVEPVGRLVQQRQQPDPRSYVGKGKLEELKQAYGEARAEVLLVDDELDPTQQRTLENALEARVVDRTQLILDIFAQHASSAEGKLQVELAQLEYNLPRMRGMWKHLERLGGGMGSVGAGVGTRGPGESQLETDRRIAGRRVTLLRRRLRELRKQRDTQRKERSRNQTPVVALAGYTNVGKSTLLNALTGAEVSVENRLFETLDPTTRGFDHEGKRYLVTDTVGFIRRLPTQLVEGFASTLEETLVADVVLHVADASLPDDRLAETIAAVETVLAGIGAEQLPVELVLNKIDRVDPLGAPPAREPLPRRPPALSRDRRGRSRSCASGSPTRFADRFEDVHLLVPYDEGARLAELYALGTPIEEREDLEDGVLVARGCRGASRAASPRSSSPRRDAQATGRAVIDLPVRRLRDDAVLPSRAYAGDAGLDLAAAESVTLGPGERAVVGTGLAVAIPDGYAGFVSPRSGLAARNGIGKVNSPGLIDSGYRGEVRVVLLNTDRREPFTVEPGMRIAQLLVVPVPRGPARGGRRAAGERARRARLRLVGGLARVRAAHPRLRDPALARPAAAVPPREGGEGRLAPPRGRRQAGESLLEALERELHEEVGVEPPSFEGPVALVDSIAPDRSIRAKHVVHVIFAGDLDGSLEGVASQDAAVSGHRLFSVDELDGIVLHPPIARFLQRWRPGDPAAYLGRMWVP